MKHNITINDYSNRCQEAYVHRGIFKTANRCYEDLLDAANSVPNLGYWSNPKPILIAIGYNPILDCIVYMKQVEDKNYEFPDNEDIVTFFVIRSSRHFNESKLASMIVDSINMLFAEPETIDKQELSVSEWLELAKVAGTYRPFHEERAVYGYRNGQTTCLFPNASRACEALGLRGRDGDKLYLCAEGMEDKYGGFKWFYATKEQILDLIKDLSPLGV